MMLPVGLELEFRYFKELRKHAYSVLAVLLAEMILLPALGLLVSLAIPMPAHRRTGILLIAACPVGDIANFFTLLVNGNLALSVAINVISCLSSLFSMVVAFALYRRVLALPIRSPLGPDSASPVVNNSPYSFWDGLEIATRV
jgi:bile acid:Na+ symporter, BASS family